MEVREVRSLDRGRRVFGRPLILIENLEARPTQAKPGKDNC